MTPPQIASTVQRSIPLMQFWGRVDGSSAYVRVQPSRLEWSLVGQEWVIKMSPMTSITSISIRPGFVMSGLVVTTAVGTAEFHVQPGIAEQAQTLLERLIADSARQLPADRTPSTDQLINLHWHFDTSVVDDFEFDHQWARVLDA